MKFYKIGFLLIVLLIVIIYSTFTGSKQKEGLTYNNTVILSDIVFNTKRENAAASIEAICQMDIDDADFLSIINSDLTDYQKIIQLRALVTILSLYNVNTDTLQNTLDTNTSLAAAINQIRSSA
jgi:hypothetical protein